MKEGSIVGLIRNLESVEIQAIKSIGYSNYPVREDVYEIKEIFKPKDNKWEMSLTLVEFPSIMKGDILHGVEFDASIFVELLPPSPDLEEYFKPLEEVLADSSFPI